MLRGSRRALCGRVCRPGCRECDTSLVAVTSLEVVTRNNLVPFMDLPPTVPLLLVEIHWRSSISENFGNLGLATTHAVILLTWRD